MECHKQLYTHKLDNFQKMGQFFEKLELPQVAQYEVANLDSPINIKQVEFVT